MRTTCWAGVRLLQDVVADRLDAHALDERLDDAEVDVRFEQRQPDLAQRRVDRRFGQPGFAAEGLEDVLQAGAERLEHDLDLRP